jgi:hypothetical protein
VKPGAALGITFFENGIVRQRPARERGQEAGSV